MGKYKVVRSGMKQRVGTRDKPCLIGSTIELSDTAAEYFLPAGFVQALPGAPEPEERDVEPAEEEEDE